MIYLRYTWRRIGLLLLILLLPLTLAQAAPEFMPVEEVQPGMHGIGKTVVAGASIEEFGVEVLGVMKNKGPAGDVILVRTYGDLIERTGGIAQGMSGSPVYINGRLVGAIAYGWALTDHKVGMVTPIGDMLKIWDKDSTSVGSVSHVESLAGLNFKPIATPLMVSGFGDQALAYLAEKLGPLQMSPYAVGDAPSDIDYGPLKAGGAVGVQLVQGDVNIGAVGTVTHIDNGKVLAFGHPFLKKGNVGFYMTNAYIFTTVRGLENSFKVGTNGTAVGSVTQDRSAGIGGEIGRFPSNVPVRISVQDETTGHLKQASVRVVQDEQLSPILAAATVYNIIDKTIDRTGPGTARIKFEITAKDMPVEKFTRENMFYSAGNIGELSVGEFFEAMSLLTSNQFNPVDIMDVNVQVVVSDKRHTAAITEAKAKAVNVIPGETIDITVKMKPYRGEVLARTIQFTVPKNQKSGPLALSVHGGGMIPLYQLLLKKGGIDESVLKGEKKQNQTFAELLQDFSRRDRNNDIVVEVLDLENEQAKNEGKQRSNKEKKKKPKLPVPVAEPEKKNRISPQNALDRTNDNNEKAKSFVTTDFIIEGDTRIYLNVTNK
ncbi:SpoIVB peptidase S55 domain-containing protein [Acetonema longum]|uniref:Peptidase S55 domain-containing protein n=1 Tax=Acetonema longum DSM 6540 TaxID=1009370 RepID=F7NM31_9FIRM|nr:SpoIVB peptidase S55 domain-containing protein [Acetonema longum]EGO62957.1 hypothetical protein ALO_15787 [Acetonema longum DSM 6540]